MKSHWSPRAALLLCLMLFLISGCGGSTRGTGGVRYEGLVVNQNSQPVPQILVTLLQNGAQAITDANGEFVLSGPETESADFTFESGALNAQTEVANIPAGSKRVTVRFRVNESGNTVEPEETEFHEDESSGNGGGSSAGDDDDDSSGGGVSGDDDDDSGTDGGASGDDDDNSGTGGGVSGDDDDDSSGGVSGDDDDDSTSSGSDDGSGEDQEVEVEAEGVITALTANAVTVDGKTFQITPETELRDGAGKSTALSTFTVGDTVKIKGTQSGEMITAERMEEED